MQEKGWGKEEWAAFHKGFDRLSWIFWISLLITFIGLMLILPLEWRESFRWAVIPTAISGITLLICTIMFGSIWFWPDPTL